MGKKYTPKLPNCHKIRHNQAFGCMDFCKIGLFERLGALSVKIGKGVFKAAVAGVAALLRHLIDTAASCAQQRYRTLHAHPGQHLLIGDAHLRLETA